MKLVIIEGEGKKETIKKYLGNGYEVFATKGHIRDLPEKDMGIDLTTFEPTYQIMPNKNKIVSSLKTMAKNAEQIFLATDPDREGEAISWHLAYILNLKPEDKCRTAFNEISEKAIKKEIENPRAIDLSLVNAQQARRVVDRLVGYKLSPFISKAITPKLSAGRVQSVALKLVVEREREIINFKSEEYWTLIANLKKENIMPEFIATLLLKDGKKIKINNKEQMDSILEQLKNANYVVKKVKKSVVKNHAPAPFITSTMQQDALNKLNMSLKVTQSIAQQLYEGVNLGEQGKTALVTYIRTDSTRVSEGAVAMAKEFIKEKFGKEYLPAKINVYKSKESAQDAHEAIRPINLNNTPEKVKPFLSTDLYKLYKLIYERFLASQMSEAEYNSVSADIDANNCTFRATGRTLKFPGYTAVYLNYVENEEKDEKLPIIEENDNLTLLNLKPEQKFTKAPARYTEATLIKAMEEKGIGRPATYTPTLLVLINRAYISKDGKKLFPTELGFKVTDLLEKYFAKVINVDFTADMETALDSIADGKKDWKNVVEKFYAFFLPLLKNANNEKMAKQVLKTDIKCEKCGGFMVEREGRYGKFLGCENFPKCRNIVAQEKSAEEQEPQKAAAKCPICGKDVFLRSSKKGVKFYGCSGYPDCKFMSWDLPIEGEKCPDCGTYLVKHFFKGGAYQIKCGNKDCKFIKEDNKKEEGEK